MDTFKMKIYMYVICMCACTGWKIYFIYYEDNIFINPITKIHIHTEKKNDAAL